MNESNRDPSAQMPLPLESEVRDKALRPPGVLPKNTQTYVILAITAVMVGAIAFSGGSSPSKPASSPAAQKAAPVIDPNLARIQEYRNRIDEQARKLAAEQAQLEQAKQALLQPSPVPQSIPPASATGNPYAPPTYPAHAYEPAPKPEKDPIAADKEKREYQSLFASNVALSYRRDETPAADTRAAKPAERRADKKQESDSVSTTTLNTAPVAADPELQKAGGKQYRLFEGTILETVLTNRLSGGFNGPVNCMVTTDVYSHDRQRLLIPKGSRVLGEAKRNDSFGQQRLAVFFHRLIMPDGFSVNLDQFHGLNQIGETGLRDQVNHHYGQIFGVSLAVGALAGLASINTGAGFNASSADLYRQGVTQNLSQSSLRILDRYLNILPTFTIREGHRVKVILSEDLMLPDYERHTMPSDL